MRALVAALESAVAFRRYRACQVLAILEAGTGVIAVALDARTRALARRRRAV